ncbi:MAG: hypothetical protein M3Q97_05425, partial [Bacteroidota bacterium]|nr:hypothetical protein [Bacteroidota bacterium]
GNADLVLKVTGGEAMKVPGSVSLDITNALVHLEENCRLDVHGALNMDNVDVTRPTGVTYKHRGIHTYGQQNVTLDNLVVLYGITGFSAHSFGSTNLVTMTGWCKFQYCDIGIYTYNVPVSATEIQLQDNTDEGWLGEALGNVADQKIEQGWVLDNGEDGVSVDYGVSSADFLVFSSTFNDNGSGSTPYAGFRMDNGVLVAVCSDFERSAYGIYSTNNTLYLADWTVDGYGNNEFISNMEAGVWIDHVDIYLDGGRNKFVYSTNLGELAIAGIYGTYPFQPSNIPATENYWVRNGTVVSPASGTDYLLFYNNSVTQTSNPMAMNTIPTMNSFDQPAYCSSPGGGDLIRYESWKRNQAEQREGGGSGPVGTSTAFMQWASPGIQSVIDDSIPVFGVEYLCNVLLNQPALTFWNEKRNIDVVYYYAVKGMAKLFTACQRGDLDSTMLNRVCSTVHAMQEHCIQNTSLLPTAYMDKYKYSMDGAILYRDKGERLTALSELDSMKQWVDRKHFSRIETWQCWINREIMLEQGIITKTNLLTCQAVIWKCLS